MHNREMGPPGLPVRTEDRPLEIQARGGSNKMAGKMPRTIAAPPLGFMYPAHLGSITICMMASNKETRAFSSSSQFSRTDQPN